MYLPSSDFLIYVDIQIIFSIAVYHKALLVEMNANRTKSEFVANVTHGTPCRSSVGSSPAILIRC